MSHLRLLFVGGRNALQKVYDTASDSSSETKAELTIGADWISDYDWLDKKEKKKGWTTDNFTKADSELYEQILNGYWQDCFDVRDPDRYGDFGWVNIRDKMIENPSIEEVKLNKKAIIEEIKKLPDDTLFHFAESHW